MVQKRKKTKKKSYLIIHFPTSEGASKVSERGNERAQQSAAERASKASSVEQANE